MKGWKQLYMFKTKSAAEKSAAKLARTGTQVKIVEGYLRTPMEKPKKCYRVYVKGNI